MWESRVCLPHTQAHTHVTANCTSACSALSCNESPPALPFSGTRRVRDTDGERVDSEVWIMCYLFKSEIQMKFNPSADTTARGSNGSVCVYIQQLSPSLCGSRSLLRRMFMSIVYWCWVLSSTDRDSTSSATTTVEKRIEIYLNCQIL